VLAGVSTKENSMGTRSISSWMQQAELPVAITMETGSTHDCSGFEPLIDEFEERYDTDELQAVLADAGFDSQGNRDYCQDSLGCPLLGAINLADRRR